MVADLCGIPVETVSSNTLLVDLGLDSLTFLQFQLAFEAQGYELRDYANLTAEATIADLASRLLYRERGNSATHRRGEWILREYRLLRYAMALLLPLLAVGLWFIPAVLDLWLIGKLQNVASPILLAAAPVLFILLFPLVAAVLSLPFHQAIRPVSCKTSLGVPLYAGRRCYGLCWTSVYYFKAAYALVLQIPLLRALVFRGFGYRGPLRFTTYPDTWIRDLPLLYFGRGAYLSNRATLGTNIMVGDGTIVVGPVRVGAGALVGHLAVVGPNTRVGRGAKLGVGSSIGLGVTIESGCDVGAYASINHYAYLSRGSQVGARAYVATRSRLESNMIVPDNREFPSS